MCNDRILEGALPGSYFVCNDRIRTQAGGAGRNWMVFGYVRANLEMTLMKTRCVAGSGGEHVFSFGGPILTKQSKLLFDTLQCQLTVSNLRAHCGRGWWAAQPAAPALACARVGARTVFEKA